MKCLEPTDFGLWGGLVGGGGSEEAEGSLVK